MPLSLRGRSRSAGGWARGQGRQVPVPARVLLVSLRLHMVMAP